MSGGEIENSFQVQLMVDFEDNLVGKPGQVRRIGCAGHVGSHDGDFVESWWFENGDLDDGSRTGGSIVVCDIEGYLNVVEYPGTKDYFLKALLCTTICFQSC